MLLNNEGVSTRDVIKFFKGKPEELYLPPITVATNVGLNEGGKDTSIIQLGVVISTYDKTSRSKYSKSTIVLQDVILRYINGKTREELSNMSNQDKIKEEMEAVIENEVGIPVEGIYFTQYILK